MHLLSCLRKNLFLAQIAVTGDEYRTYHWIEHFLLIPSGLGEGHLKKKSISHHGTVGSIVTAKDGFNVARQ